MQWDLGVGKLRAMESSATNLSSLRLAEEWRLWKRTHRKSYASSNEELERYAIWQSNAAYIENHNKHWDKFGYTLGMNQFGDLVLNYIMSKAICGMQGPLYLCNTEFMQQQKCYTQNLQQSLVSLVFLNCHLCQGFVTVLAVFAILVWNATISQSLIEPIADKGVSITNMYYVYLMDTRPHLKLLTIGECVQIMSNHWTNSYKLIKVLAHAHVCIV